MMAAVSCGGDNNADTNRHDAGGISESSVERDGEGSEVGSSEESTDADASVGTGGSDANLREAG
jgi:hypothetical protein